MNDWLGNQKKKIKPNENTTNDIGMTRARP